MINAPKIPLTNMGLRTFLQELSESVRNDEKKCPGYSVVADPSGRILITSTFDSVDDGLYSIHLEIAPVASTQD